jgi:hypothetical protein
VQTISITSDIINLFFLPFSYLSLRILGSYEISKTFNCLTRRKSIHSLGNTILLFPWWTDSNWMNIAAMSKQRDLSETSKHPPWIFQLKSPLNFLVNRIRPNAAVNVADFSLFLVHDRERVPPWVVFEFRHVVRTWCKNHHPEICAAQAFNASIRLSRRAAPRAASSARMFARRATAAPSIYIRNRIHARVLLMGDVARRIEESRR